jgi:pyruvate dehydrogenase E1 component alpha subunit
LVVTKVFRYIGHFVADDQHYRDPEVAQPWRQLDPLLRMADYLSQAGLAREEEIAAIRVATRRQVDEAIQFAREAAEPTADQLFEDLYAPDNPETE